MTHMQHPRPGAYSGTTNVWTESDGDVLKETLRQEAWVLHQLHQPPARLEDWIRRRRTLRRKLLVAAGVEPRPPALDLDVREYGTIRMDGFQIVKLTYQSRPGLHVTAHLFVPDGKGPFPAILNLHGHSYEGKLSERVAGRAQALAREGFVVLGVDAIGAGERGTVPGEFEHHGAAGVSLMAFGETLLGAQVIDNRRGIDLLQSLDRVDGSRIGVTGGSGGGNQTLWISALDERVKAAVPVVSVGTFEAYVTAGNCWCETLPGGLSISEEWGVLGLVAPNPVLILTAIREKLAAFLPKEMLRTYADTRKIYDLYGAGERLSYQIIDRPHGYFPEMMSAMLGWFKHWLQGEGSALPCPVPDCRVLSHAELMCFPGKTRPREILSLIDYVSLRTHQAKTEFLAGKTASRSRKIRDLKRMLCLPAAHPRLRSSDVVEGKRDGFRFMAFSVESDPGVLVPCFLLYSSDDFSSVVIAAHPDGKDACLRQNAAQDVLAQGKALCLVDLRNVGENRWEHVDDQVHHYGARAALWLGRTMTGNWVQDLMAVRAQLTRVASGCRIELLGFGMADFRPSGGPTALQGAGDTSVAVLAAAVLDPAFAGVTVCDLLSTYVLNGRTPVQRWSTMVSGIVNWGDVSLLAALVQCPLCIRSLVNPEGRTLSREEQAEWERESARLETVAGL